MDTLCSYSVRFLKVSVIVTLRMPCKSFSYEGIRSVYDSHNLIVNLYEILSRVAPFILLTIIFLNEHVTKEN